MSLFGNSTREESDSPRKNENAVPSLKRRRNGVGLEVGLDVDLTVSVTETASSELEYSRSPHGSNRILDRPPGVSSPRGNHNAVGHDSSSRNPHPDQSANNNSSPAENLNGGSQSSGKDKDSHRDTPKGFFSWIHNFH